MMWWRGAPLQVWAVLVAVWVAAVTAAALTIRWAR